MRPAPQRNGPPNPSAPAVLALGAGALAAVLEGVCASSSTGVAKGGGSGPGSGSGTPELRPGSSEALEGVPGARGREAQASTNGQAKQIHARCFTVCSAWAGKHSPTGVAVAGAVVLPLKILFHNAEKVSRIMRV